MTAAQGLSLLTWECKAATITMNRPDARNALNLEMLELMVDQLDECARGGADVLVLRAEGPVFCAGADVRSDDGTAIGLPGRRRALIEQVVDRIQELPVSIASVQGPAIGAGWGLAFAADVVVAADEATFRFPELGIGFLPPPALVRRFVRVAGPVRSTRLLGSGEVMRADAPTLAGLVEPVPPAELAERTQALTDHFLGAQPGLLASLQAEIRSVPSTHDH